MLKRQFPSAELTSVKLAKALNQSQALVLRLVAAVEVKAFRQLDKDHS